MAMTGAERVRKHREKKKAEIDAGVVSREGRRPSGGLLPQLQVQLYGDEIAEVRAFMERHGFSQRAVTKKLLMDWYAKMRVAFGEEAP